MALLKLLKWPALAFLFPLSALAFRAPAGDGHSEFFERCISGLLFHPQMMLESKEVRSSLAPFCECAKNRFEQNEGQLDWPLFDRYVFLKSFDQCLLPMAIVEPNQYKATGSVLFDLWVVRDIDQKLVDREPAGMTHFVTADQMLTERECVRDDLVQSCFDGTLEKSYRCLVGKVADPDVMNELQVKCRITQTKIDPLYL